MKILNLHIYILLGCFLFFIPQISTSQKYFFSHLTAEDGLSSNIIRSITKDSRGYIWVGCNNALNRYDGSKFIRYVHNPKDSTSITGGAIDAIFEDKDGILWISTKDGVCTFDYKSEKFTKVRESGIENTSGGTFYVTKKSEFILCSPKGLYIYERTLNRFRKYLSSNIDNRASTMIEDKYENLYIGTWGNGLVVLSKNRKDYIIKKNQPFSDLSFTNCVVSLAISKDDKIWIGARDGFYNGKIVEDNEISKFEIHPVLNRMNKVLPISNTQINSLIIDENGKIWIGTENGLNIYDPKTDILNSLYSAKNTSGGLSNNLINYIYNEPGGGIWLGTYQGGINYFSKGNVPFQDRIPFISQSENDKIRYVKSVHQDLYGNIWIGTDFGLHRFNKSLQLEKTYQNNSQSGSLPIGGVTAIYTDKSNELWVGQWGGGVSRLDQKTDKFIKYSITDLKNTTDSSLTGDSNTRAFVEDSRGYLWIINMFYIIDCYDRKYDSFKHFSIAKDLNQPNMEMKSAAIDKNDNIWIGTTGAGLIKFNTKDFKSKLFSPAENNNLDLKNSLPSVDVYAVIVDHKGKIWMGTGKGLCLFDPEKNTFITYSTEQGLNSEMILSIVSDSKNNIWVSTLKGISKFDSGTGYFTNYDKSDVVIPNTEVAYNDREGKLFFAGANGITVFHPDSLWKNEIAPPIVFTDFKLFDKSVLFDPKLLPNHVNESEGIVLNYFQNSFTIAYKALNFIQPEKNIYFYMLQGFDTEWKYNGIKDESNYTNINPGTYYFKVKAANNNGVLNNTERVLKIVINPAWWKTMWFRISIVFLIMLVTAAIIRLRTIQLEHQKKALKIRVHERTLEIEKQQIELKKKAEELEQTNHSLLLNTKEVELQKNILEDKNVILEQQKEKILLQKLEAEDLSSKLHDADQKKIKFLTNISHEFRTPLSLIISPLHKTLREIGTIKRDKLHIRLNLMYRNTMRLLRLINEFLDISKIEAGLLKLSVGRGNLHEFIFGITESYRYLAEQKKIEFEFISEMGNVICFFDADKIEKIINNLLSNAFKFTPSAGKITIRLLALEKNTNHEVETMLISVEDTGIGIDQEFRTKIFERFYQIDTNEGQISGTGIGLALTQELIAMYGGTIDLESEPGLGSKFIVSLPCSINHFKANEITNELISGHKNTYGQYYSTELTSFDITKVDNENLDQSKSTVLLVEDNKDIVQFLQEQFCDDFNFVFAFDGIIGFEKAVSVFPQAIILDVMMPRMNGYQLCEKLKKDERTCHIPIIFLTALAEKVEQMEGLENGADDYITKPFDVDLLKLKVVNLIETRQKLKLLYQKKLTIDLFDTTPDSFDEKFIRKVMTILDKEITNSNFGVEELSRTIGLSRTHLYRKIREITNQSPVEFIRNVRLERAAKLLIQNKYYISEVAYMTGFVEMSYFRKIFKEFYGVSPSDYSKGGTTSEEKPDINVNSI